MVWSVLFLIVVYAFLTWAFQRRDPATDWDWSGYDPRDLSFAHRFGPDFLWGVATAAHQVEGGCDNNNWSRWESETGPDGKPRVVDGHKAGLACDHWSRFREDIALMVELGVNSYRFSLEWSKIEPVQGQWDESAIAHYHEVIDAVLAAGLTPMVTLHHFTHPLWFEDLGAFEREENLAHLLRFTERMFLEYGSKVKWWCTLNEPEVVASVGYFVGQHPPGKRDPRLMAEVMANLLRAHGRMYRLIKSLPGGHDAEVGIVKDIFQFDADRSWHLGDAVMAWVMDRVMNDSLLDALHTGHFRLVVPGMVSLDAKTVEAAGSLDFVGLNYYSHFYIRSQLNREQPFTMRSRPGEVQTDMPYPVYPEGLYRALQRIARLKVPVLVTENGIADARDDRREDFIRRYLYVLARAKQDGVDVRGYYYWTLMDNFEWAEGWHMKFGLYAMDPADRVRRFRPGSRALKEIIEESVRG